MRTLRALTLGRTQIQYARLRCKLSTWSRLREFERAHFLVKVPLSSSFIAKFRAEFPVRLPFPDQCVFAFGSPSTPQWSSVDHWNPGTRADLSTCKFAPLHLFQKGSSSLNPTRGTPWRKYKCFKPVNSRLSFSGIRQYVCIFFIAARCSLDSIVRKVSIAAYSANVNRLCSKYSKLASAWICLQLLSRDRRTCPIAQRGKSLDTLYSLGPSGGAVHRRRSSRRLRWWSRPGV